VSSFSNVSSLKSTQEWLSLDVEVFSHRKNRHTATLSHKVEQSISESDVCACGYRTKMIILIFVI